MKTIIAVTRKIIEFIAFIELLIVERVKSQILIAKVVSNPETNQLTTNSLIDRAKTISNAKNNAF